MPELGLRVRLALRNDLMIELALDLAVQDLQLPISDLSQVLGKYSSGVRCNFSVIVSFITPCRFNSGLL